MTDYWAGPELDYYAPPVVGDRGLWGGDDGYATIIDYVDISILGDTSDFGDLSVGRAYPGACSNSVNGRACWAGGHAGGGKLDVIDYVVISTPGTATDFGNLTVARSYTAGVSNGINNRGVFGGGRDDVEEINTVDYITISSTGNATNFGDLTVIRRALAGCSNGTSDRGVFAGGVFTTEAPSATYYNTIDYITISSASDATNFGDLLETRAGCGGTSNGTNDRGVIAGGYGPGSFDTMDYFTISSTSDASDFGDLIGPGGDNYTAASNGTKERAVFNDQNSNAIEYITISSLGNGTNFGDLKNNRWAMAATSNA